MTGRQIFILVGVIIGTIILTNLPFIPGPKFLSAPAQLFYNGGQIVGVLGLILVPTGIFWSVKQFRKPDKKRRLTSILLWIIPLTVFLSTTYLTDLTRDFSRSFAIKRAGVMIKEIEKFMKENGYYPDTLANTGIQTPSTGIIGIDDFYYKKTNNHYNLTFYQNVILGFNYEIVTYDKTNNHSAIGEMKELYDTGFEYWKYEIFD
jgi:hypothetical protein